jgi:methyltransferase family protein
MSGTTTRKKLVKAVRRSPIVRAVRRSPVGDSLAQTAVWKKIRGQQPAPEPMAVNPLEAYFLANNGRLIHKWMHYFDIYHRHFERYRGKPVTIVEFGVSHGGSLQMWKDYFGPQARIFGVDINPACAALAEPQIEIVIGDQEDREFLRSLAAKVGKIDVLIEDGGHTMTQQIATFEELWPNIVDGGVFLLEDLHTNYWAKYGGGLRREGTFIEYAKNLIDQQHAWHSHDKETFDVDDYTRSIRGMHVYDSIIVFDKDTVRKAVAKKTGTPSH